MTITHTKISSIGLAALLTVSGFAYLAQAQEEPLTPQERYAQLEEKAQSRQETFDAAQQERKEAFEATRQEQQDAFENKKEEMQTRFEDKKASSSEALEARKEEMQGKMEERKADMQEKVAERKAALADRTQERIANLAANVSNRMDAAIARIRQIIDRFQTRMNTLADNGVDTTSAQIALDESSIHLDEAAALIANIDTVIAEVIGSESPRDAWVGAKGTYSDIKTQLKAAHESLRTALTLLKDAVRAAGLERGVSEAVAHSESSATDTDTTPQSTSTDSTGE